jgi:heat shock protein HtpX
MSAETNIHPQVSSGRSLAPVVPLARRSAVQDDTSQQVDISVVPTRPDEPSRWSAMFGRLKLHSGTAYLPKLAIGGYGLRGPALGRSLGQNLETLDKGGQHSAPRGYTEITAETGPRIHRLVTELAKAASLPMPLLYLMRGDEPRAFVTGLSPERAVLTVSRVLVEELTDRELRGVLAHELAHIYHRDALHGRLILTCLAALCGAALISTCRAAMNGNVNAGVPWAASVAVFGVTISYGRWREYRADTTGVRFSGDPEGMASALESTEKYIERYFEPPHAFVAYLDTMIGFLGGHPPTSNRVERLQKLARSKANLEVTSGSASG